MTVRRKIVGRHEDGRTVVMMAGDPLHWQYDPKQEAFVHQTKDGVVYAVKHTRPTDKDKFGHKLYRYWVARVKIDGEVHDLGEHMLALEGQEVCQIYESARHEIKELEAGGDARVHDRRPRRLSIRFEDKRDVKD